MTTARLRQRRPGQHVASPPNFGSGPQTIQLNLGTYGQANGVTQYAGTEYSLRGLTQNGVPPGSFSSLSTRSSGDSW